MSSWRLVLPLIAGLITLLSLSAMIPDYQEIPSLREQAAKAMKELRYRDALTLLERIEKAGKASFEDRDKILTCLLRLRETEEFDRRLAGYMEREADLFDKARYGVRLIMRMEDSDRYRKTARLRKLYAEVYGWMLEAATAPERRGVRADFIFEYVDFLRWDDGYINTRRVVALLREVMDLEVDIDRSGKALLKIAYEFERHNKFHKKSRAELLAAFRAVVERFPESNSAPLSQLHIGERFRSAGEFVKAVTELQAVLERWPKSSQARRAQKLIEEIREPRLTMFIEEVFRPGAEARVQVRYRNIKEIEFAAHRFDLLSSFRELKTLQRIHQAVDTSAGEPVAAWKFETEDRGMHRWYSASIKAPFADAGAFIIQGSGGGKVNRALMLITGLATVVKASGRSVLVYCADSVSGEPVNGAEILLGSDYRYDRSLLDRFIPYNQRRYYFHNFQEGRSDDSGLWRQVVAGGGDSSEMLVMARRGEEYALSESYLGYWYYSEPGPQVYIYTDRPVYRPEQKVRYRAIVRAYEKGVYRNMPNRKVLVTIYDARNQKVRQEELVTNEFGSVSGEFELGEEPPLGRWSVRLKLGDDETYAAFRVEEYKKPEFKVVVTPGVSQYRLGSEVEVTINARYYFGEPVAGARVEYEVRQRSSGWRYRPSGRYEWLYGGESPGYYYGGGRIAHKGSGTTDADGNLKITFPTSALPREKREVKVYDFTVTARVTDASRREIRGSGGTKVTSHEFGASVRTDRYVYQPGDGVSVELVTKRYDGSPRATEGKYVLYRAEWNRDRRDYDLTRVWEAEGSTGGDGKGSHKFSAEEEGYFFVRYETADAYDNIVIGSAAIWVSGDYFHAKFFRHGGIEIVPDREHYLFGDTAKLLINSQLDEATALLTVEAGEVLQARLLTLHQGANLIELPIEESFEPNIFVKVHAIKGFALYSAEQELLVPPEEKFAALKITFSKKQFKPGERGTITVEAKDWKGNPLEAEFSIGVVDSAIYYIAEDKTADIRSFFYGNRRYDSVRTSSSFEFRFYGVEEEEKFAMEDAAGGEAPAAAARESGRFNGDDEDGGLVEAEVRKDFRDSALWLAHVRTGPDGTATVEVEWPDNLTTWRTTVRAVTKKTVVGNATSDVITRKNLLVRLQTPRFLVQGDRVILSANVHNYLDSTKRAKVSIEAEGLELVGETERWIDISSGGEVRFDVEAVASQVGSARVLVKALTDEESDAMELALPVYVRGIEKFAAAAGSVERSREIELDLPAQIRPGSARLRLSVRPTIAGAMLDSLPYLIDYPYGCTEQTMSRFLPAAMVAKTLRDLGLRRPELEEKLPKVIKAGLERLYDFQHADGGWGWWKHDPGNIHMTAYVVYGLTVARQADIEVDSGRLERAVRFLHGKLGELEDKVELLNYVLYALSWSGNVPERHLNRVYDLLPKMRAYETALFALTLHNMDKRERFDSVMEQLEARADVNPGQGIVSWGKPGGWYWYQDNVEATALALMAELRKDAAGDMVKGAVRWLLAVRKGSKWKSTRDTAFAIYALTEFIKATDEFNPDLRVTIELDGSPVKTVRFTRENLFGDDGVLEFGAEALKPGARRLRIVREGSGNLYFDAFLTYFSLEERISAASTTIGVKRTYSKLLRSVDGKGREVVERVPLRDGDSLVSGDEIEVRLELSSENNYEYLVYEDFKPAGCEPTRLRSGYTYGSICSNMELRDEKVVFFIGWLPKGKSVVTYNLRAEIPGRFHALPTNGFAMYAPDVRAISDDFIMAIRDLGESPPARE